MSAWTSRHFDGKAAH